MQRHGEWPERPHPQQLMPPGGNLVKETAAVYYFEPPRAEDIESTNSLAGLLQLIRSRMWTIFFIAVLGALIGWVSVAVQTPMYKASTQIEIRSMSESDALYRIIDGGAGASTSSVSPEAYLETQLRVLQSRAFRSRVAEKMKGAPKPKTKQQPNLLSKLLSMARLKSSDPNSVVTASPTMQVLSSTRIVQISCDSSDPARAADYVNATAQEFIAYNLELQSETADRTMKWLTGQLGEMRKKVETSRATLDAYSRNTGLKMEAQQPDSEISKLKDLQRELATANVDRIAKQTAYEVTLSETQDSDEGSADIAEKLIRLRSDLRELLKTYTPEHPRVKQAQVEIELQEKVLASRAVARITRLRDNYTTAAKREERLQDAVRSQEEVVSGIAAKSMEYENLRRDLERNQRMYEDLLQKATEVSLSTAMRGSSQIRVVDSAAVPSEPYLPIMWKNVGLGLATGVFLGFGLIFFQERTCHRIRIPGEAPAYVGVPELSVIPRWEGLTSLFGAAQESGIGSLANRVTDVLAGQQPSAALEESGHGQIVAEAFRSAAASILVVRRDQAEALTMMVTSPSSGEGKSTVVANLGIAIADLGHSVLLVDGDLRVPSLHTLFDVPNTWGVSSLVTESGDLKTLPLEALCQRTPIEGLYLLTSGPGPNSVSRVLYSKRTEKLFERLSSEFEFILVDSPPSMQFSDARLIGRLVDGAVFVVRAGHTPKEALTNIKRRFDSDNIPVFGTILNGWNIPQSEPYRYYFS